LAWFALCKLGAVEVCISDAYLGSFLEHPIRLAGSETIITTAGMAERLLEIEANIPTQRLFIVETADAAGGSEARLPKFKRLKTQPFNDLYGAKATNPEITVRPEETAAVLLTSGTTGPSKGVVMPHSQF